MEKGLEGGFETKEKKEKIIPPLIARVTTFHCISVFLIAIRKVSKVRDTLERASVERIGSYLASIAVVHQRDNLYEFSTVERDEPLRIAEMEPDSLFTCLERGREIFTPWRTDSA